AFEQFNWAHDYFDVIAAANDAPALRVVDDAGGDRSLSFSELARRSAQVASFLDSQGLGQGDRLLVMLPNGVPLWETMLAAIRLGAVVIPATTLLERDDLSDRIERGRVKGIVADAQLAGRFAGLPGAPVRIAVGAGAPGWADYDRSYEAGDRFDTARTRADELLLLYFTSGTTARPKLVAHTQASYPIGHLSTMYWLGLKPGDVHLNLSSPGCARPGASRSATATARPRPPHRSAIPRGNRSSPARWGGRCPDTGSCCWMPRVAWARKARSASTSRSVRSGSCRGIWMTPRATRAPWAMATITLETWPRETPTAT